MNLKNKKNLGSPVFSLKNKLLRVLWSFTYILFFRYSPTPFFKCRSIILRLFGAKVGNGTAIYPSVKIWLPSNLIVEDNVALGPNVNVYNQGLIIVGSYSIISQGVHLCASTHNYNDPLHPLILAPITIKQHVWICADSFIGPNVTINSGAVVGARSVVVKDVDEWFVYAGNPAVKIKQRDRF